MNNRESTDRQSVPIPTSLASGEPSSLDQILANVERKEILNALKKAGGRRTLAAQLLGISRSRLYRRMDALGIIFHEPPDGHA